jgi:hypothetical protein
MEDDVWAGVEPGVGCQWDGDEWKCGIGSFRDGYSCILPALKSEAHIHHKIKVHTPYRGCFGGNAMGFTLFSRYAAIVQEDWQHCQVIEDYAMAWEA